MDQYFQKSYYGISQKMNALLMANPDSGYQ